MTEHNEQVALFTWIEHTTKSGLYPELEWVFAVPNGGYRSPKTAVAMKAEGQKRGVPDIWYPIPCLRWKGLVFEMKVKDNPLSEAQKKWLKTMYHQGWFVAVCNSSEQAQTLLTRYITGKCTGRELEAYWGYINDSVGRIRAKREMFNKLMGLKACEVNYKGLSI